MAESMVERVARAMAEAEYGKGCPVLEADKFLARAAIGEMREPTDAMVGAMNTYPSEDMGELFAKAIDAALNEQVAG